MKEKSKKTDALIEEHFASNKKDHSYVCSHRCKWASWSSCDQTSAYPGSRQSDHRHHTRSTKACRYLIADHGQTELALAASGVPWTALRNSFYAEILKDFIDLLLVNRQLLIPAGSAKHSWISREDCARAATGALIGTLTTTGPVDVTGLEALSFADLASRLSSLSDHQITAHTLPDQGIIAQVTAKGVPADAARSTIRLISWIAHESTSTPTDTVERASGTKPTSIDTILRTLVTA